MRDAFWVVTGAVLATACASSGATGAATNGPSPRADASSSGPARAPDAGTTADASAAKRGSTPAGSGVLVVCGVAPSSGETCTGVDSFVACASTACKDALARCFGGDGGTSGAGVCGAYAACATRQVDPCGANCPVTIDCKTCLDVAATCLEHSPCTAPYCTLGEPPSSSSSAGDAGVSSRDGGVMIRGTCADLATCCAAITDAAGRGACEQTLADARARAGDTDCAVVLSTYRSARVCS